MVMGVDREVEISGFENWNLVLYIKFFMIFLGVYVNCIILCFLGFCIRIYVIIFIVIFGFSFWILCRRIFVVFDKFILYLGFVFLFL